MRERMLIQRVIYCPASTCFTVSAHSLTHACMLCFTETPRSSYNKVSLTRICAHKDTSITPGKKSLLWKTKKVQIVHQLPLSVYCLCDNDVVMFARNCHVSHQKKPKKKTDLLNSWSECPLCLTSTNANTKHQRIKQTSFCQIDSDSEKLKRVSEEPRVTFTQIFVASSHTAQSWLSFQWS